MPSLQQHNVIRTVNVLCAAVFVIALLTGCSGAKDLTSTDPQERPDPLVEQFRSAYGQFRSGDLRTALSGFEQLISRDSAMYHYEAYAFRSQCLRQLEGEESGKNAFVPAWEKLRHYRRMMVDSSDVAAELKLYQRAYPELPDYLTEQGGFVPYDSMPRPLVTKAPVFPQQTLELGKSGAVWVQYQLFSNGSVKEINFLVSDRPSFEEAVRRVAGAWRFTPYVKKGRKMPCLIAVPFKFRIR